MYGLSEQDLDVQSRARTVVDEVIPLEIEVEMAGGQVPPDLLRAHYARAIELGVYATNLPTDFAPVKSGRVADSWSRAAITAT